MGDISIQRQRGHLPARERTTTKYPDGTTMVTDLVLMSPQRGIAVPRYTLTATTPTRTVKLGPMTHEVATMAERRLSLRGGDHE